MRHYVGALLPSEQMVAGMVVAGLAFFFLGAVSIWFWVALVSGAGVFLNGLGSFIRVGGLKGELARSRLSIDT